LGGTEVLKATTGILTSFTVFFRPRYTLSDFFLQILVKIESFDPKYFFRLWANGGTSAGKMK
jgi:hypothetical protein